MLPDLISSWAKPVKQHWTDVRPCGPWDRPSGAAASKVSPTVTLAVRNCCLGNGEGRTFVKSVQVLLNKEMEIRVPGRAFHEEGKFQNYCLTSLVCG